VHGGEKQPPQASTSPTMAAVGGPLAPARRRLSSLSLSAYALFFSPHLLRQMSHAPIKNNGGRAGVFPPHASPNQAREQQPVLGASSARGVTVTRRFTLRTFSLSLSLSPSLFFSPSLSVFLFFPPTPLRSPRTLRLPLAPSPTLFLFTPRSVSLSSSF